MSPPSACTERQWYHTDIAGSVLARSDSSGNVVRFDYQPWGEPWTAPTTAVGDRQYNGRIFDSGTGFHDYGARMYWPEIGRFISVDPAEPNASEPTTFNRYAYVLNNPYKYVDPNGRTPTWVTTVLGLLAGGAYGAITSYLSEEGFNWNAVAYWGTFGAVVGLTLGAGAEAYLARTATIRLAELTAGTGTATGIAGKELVQKIPGLANTINHIFGEEAHNLGGLVDHFGSEEDAFNALYDATSAVVEAQDIKGIFETVVDIADQAVTVRGNVIDDVLRITTAFIADE